MLTRKIAIDSIVSFIDERISKDKQLTTQKKYTLNRTAKEVTNLLSTNVTQLANARLLLDGLGSYMAADKEELYLESYINETMIRYVQFIDEAQQRFETILEAVNSIIEHYPEKLYYFRFKFDDTYCFWIDNGSIQISADPSLLSIIRNRVDNSLPISVEVYKENSLLFSDSIYHLQVFLEN